MGDGARSVDGGLPIGLDDVLAQTPVVLFALDPNGNVTLSEGRGLDRMGFKPRQLVGQNVHDFYADRPEFIERARRALAGESFCTVDTVGDGVFETHFAPQRDETGKVVGVIGMSLDITERHDMQQRLVEVERLASMGTVAATVAHEINNPLTYVIANLGVLAARLDRGSTVDARALLADIREGAERVARIVGDLKGFARADDLAQPTDVVSALERAIALADAELRPRARVVRDYRPVPCVLANPVRLGQVFVNLLVNAAHAFRDDGADHEVVVRVLPRDGAVIVEIQDDGVGISADALGRIFDPFFTTKPSGTGLGLSISKQIVQRYGGKISAASVVGEGSTFCVQLRAG